MAKIGNEATLILKLARERMEKALYFRERKTVESDDNFIEGYRVAIRNYNDTLTSISLELERK